MQAEIFITLYNKGLIGNLHPLRDAIEYAVFAQDDLNGLMDYYDMLENEVDPNEGFYVHRGTEMLCELAELVNQAHLNFDKALETLQNKINEKNI